MISYAQNFEDVMLMRALADVERGFYIDVGAAWPDQDSVTKVFYEKGWQGINIEPNPDFLKILQDRRPRDHNIGAALGRSIGTLPITIFEGSGLSTLVDSIAESEVSAGRPHVRRDVQVTTLDAIWTTYIPEGQDVHFLKVDVEGFERAVLEGNNWSKNRPWIVLVEATIPNSQIEVYDVWEELLINADYSFVYTDGLNRFYVAKEHASLIPAFKFPPNIFDGFKLRAQFEVEQRLMQAEGEFEALREKTAALEHRLNDADRLLENQISDLQAKLTRMERKAFESEREAQRLRKSVSWRITLPMRFAADLAILFFPATRRGINKVIHGTIKVSQRPLSRLISLVLETPEFSEKINGWLLRKYPALHAQLLEVHTKSNRNRSSLDIGFDRAKELTYESLTPRGREIYVDLKNIFDGTH